MGKVLHYLSFRGRANRQRYWFTSLATGFSFFAVLILAWNIGSEVPAVGVVLVVPLLLLFTASMAVSARRLHDRNKSAWWMVVLFGIPWFISLFAGLGMAGGGSREAGNFIEALGLPFSIWAFVELCCLKGTPGPNRFGDDPLGPRVEGVFA